MQTLIENEHFRVRFDTQSGLALLHLSVYKWSKSLYQAGRRHIWPAILAELRNFGFTKVYATPFEDDAVAQKLIERFGFKKLYIKSGLCVMCRSTKGV